MHQKEGIRATHSVAEEGMQKEELRDEEQDQNRLRLDARHSRNVYRSEEEATCHLREVAQTLDVQTCTRGH